MAPDRLRAAPPARDPRASGSESGLTLAAVVILTVVLVSLTGGLMAMSLTHHQENELDIHRLRAMAAAEAGIARVVDEVWATYRTAHELDRVDEVSELDGSSDPDDKIVHTRVDFANGSYDVQVVEVVPDGLDHADVRILATGRSGSIERQVTVVMRYGRTPSKVFNYAYFINNFGWLWGSGIRVNGDVCSNGNFSCKDATVNGDIYASRNEALGALGTVDGASRQDAIDWYRANTGTRSRPTSPTCDDDGDDLNGNGLVDEFEYGVGYDGTSDRLEQQKAIEMPYLGQLEIYEELATRQRGTMRQGGSLVIDGVHEGNLMLEGTAADPIVVNGPVVVSGDIAIKGYITGQGTIYAGRNLHVAGNVQYVDPPAWPKPSSDPHGDAAKNETKDLVGLVARGNVVIGDYTSSTWTSSTSAYLRPSFTQAYPVAATDADNGYVTQYVDGEPYFHGNYTSTDGGKKDDGSDRRYYESTWSDADFHAFAGGDYVEHIDGVMYTNHAVTGRVGSLAINGTMVSRDEAIIYSGSITMTYDVRLHSNGYETLDIWLPRAPLRSLLFWSEGRAVDPDSLETKVVTAD